MGEGAQETSAALIASMSGLAVAELLLTNAYAPAHFVAHQIAVLQAALQRHRELSDPVELLAALGGFEIAMMVGTLLVAASRRHLILIDGLPALAALTVASRIAPAITDYCVFCRSHTHGSLDRALGLFQASALLELGIDSIDGTGATLAWPLVRSAAALLTEVAEGEDAGPSMPAELIDMEADAQAAASGGANWSNVLHAEPVSR
jgi:nicotinate-nucleotide--dimethylbenzimidazole phosphoribosyltransferase